jgi:hypothetical protein
MRRFLSLIALLVTAMVIEPATAASPTFSGCGKFVKDNPADATNAPTTEQGPAEAEIEAAWIDAGGPKPSLNIQIANLTGEVPPPATAITYDALYQGVVEGNSFVRAYLDFSGSVVYEWGQQEVPAEGVPTTRYVYKGDTEGEMFTGEHGVVRVVIPPEAGGKPGTVLKAIEPETQIGRTTVVPGAVTQSPSRGLGYQSDNAPLGSVTIGDCAPGSTPPSGGGGTTPPPSTPNSTTPSSQAGPAPVTLVTKKLKRAKAKKAVKVKLKTTEALTAVAVRLSKGKTVYGTGKLAELAGTGTVKFKLKKAIKKGTYAFDVVGTDGQGRRRIASLKLKVS